MNTSIDVLLGSIPTADRAALAGLSDDARDNTLALLSIYNAVAPIHRAFPTEVLSEIFSHCWQDPRSIAVAHVCRHWRSIALKTPRLWAAALPRLGSCSPNPGNANPAAAIYHFLDHFANTLAPHAARLVDLYVRLGNAPSFFFNGSTLSALCKFLTSGAPNLEVLGITFPGYVGMYEDWLPLREDRDDDFGRTASARGTIQDELEHDLRGWSTDTQAPVLNPVALPRLHTLRCIPIDLFPHFTTPTLRDVCVTPAQFTDDHLEDFAEALTQCPALERLKFWIVGGDFSEDEEEVDDYDSEGEAADRGTVESYLRSFDSSRWSRVDPVTVPALRHLVLNTGIYPASHLYLRSLSCPLPTTLEVTTKDLRLSDLVSSHEKLGECIQNADTARICNSDRGDTWMSTELTTLKDGVALARFALSMSESYTGPAAPDCAPVFRKHGAHITSLAVRQNEDMYFDTRDVLHALPNLTSLDVAGECVPGVFRTLLRREPEYGTPQDIDGPNCRRLRTLAVAFPRARGSVQKVIEASPTGWEEAVATGVRDDLAELVKMLSGRASSGLRLERLEWRTYVPPPALYDQAELETLVDGPVVFSGITYQANFPKAPRLPKFDDEDMAALLHQYQTTGVLPRLDGL
ncbi:uncharacterized protein BXZ73DRAFT_106248 [Epithele typhae]|uniref:uncharacterized protein n=1 Tax=Epithele typhae TaxID=378194 RepID=UPI002008C4E0|nr:uncharacterized protein BXZ73DRAFT_106248 [Epithele typhae]KAH9915276.1 hypothetical protein BXZ73DRAFT_106248 [Epithele typhae]